MNPILLFKKVCSSKWSVLALAFIFSANLSMAQVTNDDCGDAIMLSCGESVIGNNDEATTEMLPSCGLVFPGQTVWYTIMGTGGEITATTCNSTTNFDSQIGVFSGSCGDLTCVAGNNNDVGCNNRRLSTVSFDSEAGELYYIVVAGVSGAGGNYELSVSCEEVAPSNDLCADAESINCGDTVDGSTATATNSGAPGFCGTSLSSAPGVWYELAGDGSLVTASLCGSSFDTKIGVFSGSCGDLDCVTGNDDECGLQSEVEFNTTAGVSYYIYVTGFSSSAGDFTLSVSCAAPVANDDCVNALPLDCNSSVTGSTVGAGAESVSFCGTSLTSAGGVWYEVIGTGFDITVSTCNPGTNFDTKLGVFTGSCGDLECVGGADDASPSGENPDPACVISETGSTFNRASTVTISESVEGQSYFVLVTGFSSNTGTFELSAICEAAPPPPANGSCDEAVAISCDDGSIIGDTNQGSISAIDCGNSGDQQLGTSPGLWYTITGDDKLVSLSTCNEVLDFDVRISVFTGSCDALSCVAFANNGAPGDCAFFFNRAASLEFPAIEGQIYYIYVNGVQGATGNFQLDIDCRPINDDCGGATPIECGATASGSTADANPDDFPACGTSNGGARGVWYTIIGNGNVLTAETCGSSFDTKLFVFEGSCEVLACIDGNDDACSLQSRVQWSSIDGVTYYILVSGFSSSSAGNYTLSIPGDCSIDPGDCSADGIIDDVCDADCLEIDVETAFSNAGATAQAGEVSPGAGTGASSCNSTDGWCSFETDVDNSIWFKFIAPEGGCVNVSATDADLQLAIWQATDCSNFGTFTEVAANDDSGPGNSPLLEFVSVNPGEVYWVQIDGFNGVTETDGTVLVSTCPDATGIAACEAATTILCGESITGSTSGIAALDLNECDTEINTAGGAWFRFDGIGDNVTFTTCNEGTNYDTKLAVFTGTCTDQDLICVGGNDDGSPSGDNPDAACVVEETGITFNRASTVTFAAMTGTTYYIYVTGFLTNTGTFELSVDCGSTTLVDNPSGLQANDIHLNNSKYAGSEAIAVGEFYPNPAEYGSTNIEIYAPVEGEAQIQLFDNIGRLANVTEVELYGGVNTVALQLGNLPAGSYFANIKIGDVVERKKLIIAK